jgi:poly-gamma-glutamate synthesis protein (capsule biosynthesis protein)
MGRCTRLLAQTLAAALCLFLIAAAGAPSFADDTGRTTQITISFAGDTTLGNNAGASWFAARYNEKGAGWFFGNVKKVFAKDDLTVVNLEGALTSSTTHIYKPGSPVYYFRGPTKYTKILTKGSVEVCNIANNHSMDYGERGYSDTKKALKKVGIAYYGNGTVKVVTVKGVKVGFVGLKFTSDRSLIKKRIKSARKKGAEVVIFTTHDGTEGVYKPNSSQIAAARAAIDCGADAVIMHHPHRVQGTETYKGKFIAWSLGNFCFGGNSNPSDKDSMIVQLTITKDNNSGEITGIKPKVIPARISSHSGYNDLRPKVATGKEKKRIAKKIKSISGNYLKG